MKLPETIEGKIAVPGADHLKAAPWFEVLFWNTWLRFRCPPPTAKHPLQVDLRPFVNTESRRQFTEEEDGNFVKTTVFTTAWKLGPRSIFRPRKAQLKLRLWCLGVDRRKEEDIPDLFDPAIAIPWLIKIYRGNHATLGQMGFLPHQNGFAEVVFTDAETAQRIADAKEYAVEVTSSNSHLVYHCQPFKNHLDYFVPVSNQEVVQFAFTIEADEEDAANKEAILQEAEQRVRAIISSLSLIQEHSSRTDVPALDSGTTPAVADEADGCPTPPE